MAGSWSDLIVMPPLSSPISRMNANTLFAKNSPLDLLGATVLMVVRVFLSRTTKIVSFLSVNLLGNRSPCASPSAPIPP